MVKEIDSNLGEIVKNLVKDQARKMDRNKLIWTCVIMAVVNFIIMWYWQHSSGDEFVAQKLGEGILYFFGFALPNLGASLIPVLYMSSNAYMRKRPRKIESGVKSIIEKEDIRAEKDALSQAIAEAMGGSYY